MVHSSKRKLALVSAMTAFGLTLTACGGGTATTTAPATGGSSSSSQAAPAASGRERDLGKLRGFSRTGVAADDHHRMMTQGGRDGCGMGGDRQFGWKMNVWKGTQARVSTGRIRSKTGSVSGTATPLSTVQHRH